MTTEQKKKFITNFAFAACVLIVLYFFLKYLLGWLLPFVIAFIIAYLLQRPINYILKKTKLKRQIVSPIVTTIMVIVVGALLFVTANALIKEFIGFITNLPTWYQNSAMVIIANVNRIIDGLRASFPMELDVEILNVLNNLSTNIQNALIELSTGAVSWIAGKAGAVPSAVVSFIISIVAIYFISSDFENLKKSIVIQVPEKHRKVFAEMRSVFQGTVVNMLKGYLTIMLITFVELTIGLTILQVDNSVVLSVLIAIVDILPVLGTGTVLIPWSLISLITGDTFLGVGLIILYVIILIVRNIIEPKFIGKRIGLKPLVTLVSMYLGLQLAGVAGMFIFPLAVAFLKNLHDTGVVKIWKTEE